MTVSSNSEVVALWGECGEFSMPGRIWQAVLGRSWQYGWQPQGTLPPAPELRLTHEATPGAFDGSYHPAYAQRIHVDDVVALASALERALQDLPDHDIGSPATMSGYWVERKGPVSNLIAELSGRNKAGVRDFITHCREGGEIWIC